MKLPNSGGGWAALKYTWRKGREAGGLWKFYRALRSRNACKTCALGMGGQRGGMVNEAGRFPEVCKKSMQAMAADMQGRIGAEFWREYGVAELQQCSPRELEMMGRLGEPVMAGEGAGRDSRGEGCEIGISHQRDSGRSKPEVCTTGVGGSEPEVCATGAGHFRPISWDAALEFCAARLRETSPDENFFYFSGRSSNEAAFLLQLFARVYGTNHVNNCSYYCHQASGVGLASALGSGTATLALEDLEHCDLLFLIGGNPASNHPRLMRTLVDLRRRGGRVIVINPIREVGLVNFRVPSDVRSMLLGSEIASTYIQPHVGGDIALLIGIAKAVIELGAHDETFAGRFTTGYDEFRASVQAATWEEIERSSGVASAEIRGVARIYAESRATVFSWTMGITHHKFGVDNVRAIVNLALLRGMAGKPGAGLLPIRGHSNVQGIGSVGVTPRLRDAVFQRLQEHFGVKLPTTAGMDTMACIEAAAQGRFRNAWCLGGNLFGASPDAKATAAAFAKLDTVVYLSTTLNTGHAWGLGKRTLILPVAARDEESQATTQESMFNYVRLSDGGPARVAGARSEVEIVAELAERVLGNRGPIDWGALRQHRNIRAAIAKIVPGYEEIAQIDATKREFHVSGRVLHEPRFPTADGKARYFVTPMPALAQAEDELRLTTLRSEGQFNTVVYEEEDIYRGQERRDVILMNAADMRQRGLKNDQQVVVESLCGRMRRIRVRAFAIRAGSAAMYYPEANVLVSADVDRESRTPAFKSVMVRVAADDGTALVALAGAAARGVREPRPEMPACK